MTALPVGGRPLAEMVTAPKFERPWRPAAPPPLSLSELVRVCEALRTLDRRPGPIGRGSGVFPAR